MESLVATAAPAGSRQRTSAPAPTRCIASLPPEGVVLAFAHGHVLRVLVARWLGLAAADGALFVLAPGGVAALGHEHGRRVLRSLG